MVFGLNALVTKPAISLAPMVTVAILNRYGYSSVVNKAQGGALLSTAVPLVSVAGASSAAAVELTTAMFYTTCLVPVCTGLLQLITWHFYSIQDSHKSVPRWEAS
jgi:Na+/melibiose symporter-like transporter